MLINKDIDSSQQGNTDIRAVKVKACDIKRTIDDTESIEAAFPLLNTPKSHVISPVTTPTPLKGARVTRKWLEAVISPLPSTPSAELEPMLVIDDKSTVDEVIRRADIVLTALFPISQLSDEKPSSDINLMERLWSEQRRSEALKLYCKVLESVCQSEAQKLKTNDLSLLLANERFHRCLLACSAELVSVAHTGNSMMLSIVLERTGITAFDLSKVIEIFITHEPKLPRELKRHLNSLEEILLERRVWEKGSSLYNSLIVARPALADEIIRLQLLSEPMPSLETIALHNPVYFGGFLCQTIMQKHNFSPAKCRSTYSPKRARTEPNCTNIDCPPILRSPQVNKTPTSAAALSLRNAFISPMKSNDLERDASSDASIDILFSKMLKLAAIRIQSIAIELKLSQQLRDKVYFLFQQILNQRTTLFFNRHMDQIVLCSFYALAKMSGICLTFRKIYANYMKQSHTRSQAFCSLSRNKEKSGRLSSDLIEFYNEVFVPSVKSFLEQICNVEPLKQVYEMNNDNPPSSYQKSIFESFPNISPKKVSPSHNVYLSPLKPSKKDILNSSLTKSYYAFVGKSIHPYESPSKQLSDINEHLNRTMKTRRSLKYDNANVPIIRDDDVVKSLFLQNNSCASS